jgi:signal peptidase I
MATYFSIILVVASALTGLVWLVYSLFFAPKVVVTSASADGSTSGALAKVLSVDDEMPAAVDFCKQMFPIFFGVMIFRSFIYEPFQIPSGSMFPTLLVGDFLLVEKFAYSLRDPVARAEILATGAVKRGDVIVFKYPLDEKVDYIKRVVGLPGETVHYRGKQIYIQAVCVAGEICAPEMAVNLKSMGRSNAEVHGASLALFTEKLGEAEHQILRDPRIIGPASTHIIPQGKYFVMGDNRDNSADSRRWGFVPEENIVGKAVFIWTSFEFDRKEEDFLPTFIPTGIRFDRIGAIK